MSNVGITALSLGAQFSLGVAMGSYLFQTTTEKSANVKGSLRPIRRKFPRPVTPNKYHSMDSTSTETSAQIQCAERLGVDISECNRHGVFKNRHPEIKDSIMYQLRVYHFKGNWDDVTPKDLLSVTTVSNIAPFDSFNRNDFDGLTNLNIISFQECQMKKLGSGTFDFCPNLTELILNNGELEEIESSVFNNLKNLKSLWLTDNRLKKLPVSIFEHTPNLSLLRTDGNHIIFTIPQYKAIQSKPKDFLLCYDREHTQNQSGVNMTNSIVTFSEMRTVFYHGTDCLKTEYLYPNKPIDIDNAGWLLTNRQIDFLCEFYFPDIRQTYPCPR